MIYNLSFEKALNWYPVVNTDRQIIIIMITQKLTTLWKCWSSEIGAWRNPCSWFNHGITLYMHLSAIYVGWFVARDGSTLEVADNGCFSCSNNNSNAKYEQNWTSERSPWKASRGSCHCISSTKQSISRHKKRQKMLPWNQDAFLFQYLLVVSSWDYSESFVANARSAFMCAFLPWYPPVARGHLRAGLWRTSQRCCHYFDDFGWPIRPHAGSTCVLHAPSDRTRGVLR